MLDITLHRNILLKILKDIYTDNTLSSLLGFKGGTCAYLFCNLPRFSVDLDFDILNKEKEDYVLERIEKIISSYGKIEEARKKRFNLFFLLSYKKGMHNIKIEVNRVNFGSRYELKTYLGISMKVMAPEDMMAHKMVAMHERIGRTNRDIFDTWFFLNNDWPVNKKIIEGRTGLSFKEFLQKNIKMLEKIPNNNILSGMGELLNEKQKAWVKKNLKKDVLFLLKLRLENEK